LVTSVIAAKKKNSDVAIGNIVGSNIFNILWIVGVSGLITPIAFAQKLNFDILVTIGATFLLFIFMFFGKKHVLERWQGGIFLGLYVSYIIYLIIRG
jgi:cation:H+ antiporter